MKFRKTTATRRGAATMMMTETDKHTGRLLLLLSDTLGQHIRLTGVAVAVAVGSVLLNSPCCVRRMRQLAAACNCESKSVRARAGGYCIGVYVCVCVRGQLAAKQTKCECKREIYVVREFYTGRAFELWKFRMERNWTIDNSLFAECISSAKTILDKRKYYSCCRVWKINLFCY